jgi:integrase
VLRDELTEYRARLEPAPEGFVFGTSVGKKQGATNIRRRVLARPVKHADTQLTKAGEEPLPSGLTPHSLRSTFASLLFALGDSPPYVMGQMGHSTPTLTLLIYARQMDRRDGEPERLRALVEGRDWVATGSSRTDNVPSKVPATAENGPNGQ